MTATTYRRDAERERNVLLGLGVACFDDRRPPARSYMPAVFWRLRDAGNLGSCLVRFDTGHVAAYVASAQLDDDELARAWGQLERWHLEPELAEWFVDELSLEPDCELALLRLEDE